MTDRQAPRTPRRGPSGGLYLALAAVIMGLALLVVWGVSRQTRTDPTGPAPSSTASTSPATSAPPTTEVPAALTADVLVTPDDLAGIGLAAEGTVPRDAPVFPVLCGAGSWSETWSAPVQGVGHDLPGPGATVGEYVVGYADAAATAAALDRLVQDATDCPVPDTGGSVAVTSVDIGLGDGSAVFLLDDGGGRDGPVLSSSAVAVRSGDHLLMVSYTSEEENAVWPGPGGDDSTGGSPQAESTARSVAEVALARLETFTTRQD